MPRSTSLPGESSLRWEWFHSNWFEGKFSGTSEPWFPTAVFSHLPVHGATVESEVRETALTSSHLLVLQQQRLGRDQGDGGAAAGGDPT